MANKKHPSMDRLALSLIKILPQKSLR